MFGGQGHNTFPKGIEFIGEDTVSKLARLVEFEWLRLLSGVRLG